LALCGWFLVLGLRPLCRRVGIAWRYGLANIARRGAASVAQSVALGLGIMAILLLTVVRGDLLANWQVPMRPNHFAITSSRPTSRRYARSSPSMAAPRPRFTPSYTGDCGPSAESQSRSNAMRTNAPGGSPGREFYLN
jgi:putative ABC transport system permease protein